MTTKHTPGPYRAEAINSPLSTRTGFRIRRDDGGGTDPVLAILYDTPDGEVSAEEARANADLFAAAPDLAAFVRQMARLVTPRDADQVAEYCREHGRDPATMTEDDLEDMESDLDGDRCHEDALGSYKLIRMARAIVARLDGQNGEA